MTSFSIDPANDARILVGDPAKPDGGLHAFDSKGVLDPVLAATVCEMLGRSCPLTDDERGYVLSDETLKELIMALRDAEAGFDKAGEGPTPELLEEAADTLVLVRGWLNGTLKRKAATAKMLSGTQELVDALRAAERSIETLRMFTSGAQAAAAFKVAEQARAVLAKYATQHQASEAAE